MPTKKWFSRTEASERTGLDEKIFKYWCETEAIPAGKRKVKGQKGKQREWAIDPAFVKEIELIHKRVGGIENLLDMASVAEIVSIEEKTIYAYVNRGIPVRHIEGKDIRKAIKGVEGFGGKKPKLKHVVYDMGSYEDDVLAVPSFQYTSGGKRYVAREVAMALRSLNILKVKGWIPTRAYSKIVGEPYKRIKHHCYIGKLTAGKGLNRREWLIDPSQVKGREPLKRLKEYQEQQAQKQQEIDSKVKPPRLKKAKPTSKKIKPKRVAAQKKKPAKLRRDPDRLERKVAKCRKAKTVPKSLYNTLKTKYGKLERNYGALERKVESLQEKVQAQPKGKRGRKVKTVPKSRYGALQRRYGKLEKKVESLQEKVQAQPKGKRGRKVKTVPKSLYNTLKTKYGKLERNYGALERKVDSLQEKLQAQPKRKRGRKAKTILKSQYDALESKYHALERKVDSLQEKVQTYEIERTKHRQRIKELGAEVADYEEERVDLTEQTAALEKEGREYEGEETVLRKACKKLQRDLSREKQKYEKRIRNLEKQLKATVPKKQYKESQEELTESQEELTESQQENQEYQKRIKSLEEEIQKTTTELKQTNQKLQDVKKENTLYKGRISFETTLQKEKRAQTKKVEKAEKETTQYKAQCDELSTKLSKAKEELAMFRRRYYKETVDQLKPLLKSVNVVNKHFKGEKVSRLGHHIKILSEYLRSASEISRIAGLNDPLYKPALKTKQSFSFSVGNVAGWIMQYSKTKEQRHADAAKAYVNTLETNLNDSINPSD